MSIVTDVILPIALAFIMFALGLGLTFDDFARVATRPRDFIVGAVSQILLLPVVAFLLVSVWPLPPELALGVMIIAAAPGGVTSNILTSFARGDVALSISLTAVISLLSVITIPIIVVFSYTWLVGGDAGADVSVAGTAISVFVIVTVPVVLGLVVRRFAAGFATGFEPWARKISAALFVLVLAGAILAERDNIVEYFCPSRVDHPGAERADDGVGVYRRPDIRVGLAAAHRHLARMWPAEWHPGDRCGDAVVRRRARGGAGGDLQPNHVRHRADLHRVPAARPAIVAPVRPPSNA